MKKSKQLDRCLICTRGQRAGLCLSFVGVFVCGLMLGLGVETKNINENKRIESEFSKAQCSSIRFNISNNNYNDVAVLAQMYQIYNENCAGRDFEEVVVVPEPENDKPLKTCEQIELYLQDRLPFADGDPLAHIDRAKIYAQLSERGCPENSEKYVAAAQRDLEIARALRDDNLDEYEMIGAVETYKRLDMQAAAEEIFETAKKLTNPAIDFILEVEKILDEK